MQQYNKAIYAFIVSLLGAVTTAVGAATPHTFSAVDTLGWLAVAGTVVAATGAVFGIANSPAPTPVTSSDTTPATPVELLGGGAAAKKRR